MKRENGDNGSLWRWVGLIFVVWIVYAIIGGCLTHSLPPGKNSSSTWAQLGTFGDFLGGLGVLFAGLGFASIFYTFKLQRENNVTQQAQLDLQQKDLEQQKRDREEDIKRQQDFQRKANYINAVSALAQSYAAYYSADPLYFNREWETASDETKRHQVKGKLDYCTKTLEILRDKIRIDGDFAFADVRSQQESPTTADELGSPSRPVE